MKAKGKRKPVRKYVVAVAVFAHPDVSDYVFLLLACGHWTIDRLTEVQERWSDTGRNYGSFACSRCVLPGRSK